MTRIQESFVEVLRDLDLVAGVMTHRVCIDLCRWQGWASTRDVTSRIV